MKIELSGIWKCLSCCVLILASACSSSPSLAQTGASAAALLTVDHVLGRHLAEGDALLIGAGDIVLCDSNLQPLQPAKDTAALIKKFPAATVVTFGDNVYQNGTTDQFRKCYDTAWGDFKERTWPSPGNHDYGIYQFPRRNNADPYFEYFGTNAGEKGKGYYARDLGSWHIVSLNSMVGKTGAPPMAEQLKWLEDDLAKNQKPCILAFWHHPLFSSGDEHGDEPGDPGRSMGPLWEVLRKYKADVILNGHDHHYERFALQDSQKKPKPTPDGIRELIVGTGGGEDRGLGTVKANSEVRLPHVYGVLLMTLHPNSYDWDFLQTDGKVGDSSSTHAETTACH